jgi:hypothetical protein
MYPADLNLQAYSNLITMTSSSYNFKDYAL